MRLLILKSALVLSFLGASVLPARAPGSDDEPKDRIVDLVICLDTSGSMQGLIDAARTKLWAVVNDLALAKPTPRLRVALLTFGNDGHSKESGWVHVQTDFTEDLDRVSQSLFALTTNGGTELVGRVLKASMERLTWTMSPNTLKMVFVAGNESADQDRQFSFRDVVREIVSKDITVNAIYCGNVDQGDAAGWKEVAKLGDGSFTAIDHQQNRHVATPYDAELTKLSGKINSTYIPLGAEGKAAATNQRAQDKNAEAAAPSVSASRATTKGGSFYRASWDLVEAEKSKEFKWSEVKDADLPEEMRKLSLDERKAYVATKAKERAEIQAKIGELGKKRSDHISEELKKEAEAGKESFDAAIRGAIRSQAEKKGYHFEQK